MDILKEVLEIIYFLSGPALVVIAYKALSQIKVAREQIEEQRAATRITSKRDALKISSEQLDKYHNEIIPLQNVLDKEIGTISTNFFKNSKVEITENEIKVFPVIESGDTEELLKIVSEFGALMNAMESFSSYFVSGVADEKVVFSSISTNFCDQIESLLPLIMHVSKNRHSYKSIKKLFHIWYRRIESDNLKQQKIDLEQQLKKRKDNYIDVIGDLA